MYIKITGPVKNGFGRVIPEGNIIEVSEARGREMIRMDLAELVSRDLRMEYTNEIQRIKNKEQVTSPSPERKSSWFGRLIGIN